MAASRVLSRLSPRISSLSLKSNTLKPTLPTASPSISSSSVKSISRNSRLPVQSSCLLSMIPLHSTTASSRLQSLLPMDSQSWGLIPQGLLWVSRTAQNWDAKKGWYEPERL